MSHSMSPAVPSPSRCLRPHRARSHIACALQLMILVVVTGLVVGFLAAGVFVGVLDQLTTARAANSLDSVAAMVRCVVPNRYFALTTPARVVFPSCASGSGFPTPRPGENGAVRV